MKNVINYMYISQFHDFIVFVNINQNKHSRYAVQHKLFPSEFLLA